MYKNEQTFEIQSGMWAPFPSRHWRENDVLHYSGDQDFKITGYYSHGIRDSAVGIATRYGLDGLGIESRWGRDFPLPARPALRPTQPPIQWVPRAKWPGRGVGHPTHLAPRLKKE
jgi:hypothetical protein